jgi:hypothetical protein
VRTFGSNGSNCSIRRSGCMSTRRSRINGTSASGMGRFKLWFIGCLGRLGLIEIVDSRRNTGPPGRHAFIGVGPSKLRKTSAGDATRGSIAVVLRIHTSIMRKSLSDDIFLFLCNFTGLAKRFWVIRSQRYLLMVGTLRS